jgi:hypothetical protein
MKRNAISKKKMKLFTIREVKAVPELQEKRVVLKKKDVKSATK